MCEPAPRAASPSGRLARGRGRKYGRCGCRRVRRPPWLWYYRSDHSFSSTRVQQALGGHESQSRRRRIVVNRSSRSRSERAAALAARPARRPPHIALGYPHLTSTARNPPRCRMHASHARVRARASCATSTPHPAADLTVATRTAGARGRHHDTACHETPPRTLAIASRLDGQPRLTASPPSSPPSC